MKAVVVERTETTLIFRFEDPSIEAPYSSGAPVLDRAGDVVGINVGGGWLDGERLGHANSRRQHSASPEPRSRANLAVSWKSSKPAPRRDSLALERGPCHTSKEPTWLWDLLLSDLDDEDLLTSLTPVFLRHLTVEDIETAVVGFEAPDEPAGASLYRRAPRGRPLGSSL